MISPPFLQCTMDEFSRIAIYLSHFFCSIHGERLFVRILSSCMIYLYFLGWNDLLLVMREMFFIQNIQINSAMLCIAKNCSVQDFYSLCGSAAQAGCRKGGISDTAYACIAVIHFDLCSGRWTFPSAIPGDEKKHKKNDFPLDKINFLPESVK